MTEEIYKTTRKKVKCYCLKCGKTFKRWCAASYTGPNKERGMPGHCDPCRLNTDYIHGSAQPEAHGIGRR